MLLTVMPLKAMQFNFIAAAMVFLSAALLACVCMLYLSRDQKKEKKEGGSGEGEKGKESFLQILGDVVKGPKKPDDASHMIQISGFPLGSSKVPTLPPYVDQSAEVTSDNPFVVEIDPDDDFRMTARHVGTADIAAGGYVIYSLTVEPMYENPLEPLMEKFREPLSMTEMKTVTVPGFKRISENGYFMFFEVRNPKEEKGKYASLYCVFDRMKGFRAACVTMSFAQWKSMLPAIRERFEGFNVDAATMDNGRDGKRYRLPASTVWMNRTREGLVDMMLFTVPVGGARSENDCEYMKVYMSGCITNEPYDDLTSRGSRDDDMERFARMFRLMDLELASLSVGNLPGIFWGAVTEDELMREVAKGRHGALTKDMGISGLSREGEESYPEENGNAKDGTGGTEEGDVEIDDNPPEDGSFTSSDTESEPSESAGNDFDENDVADDMEEHRGDPFAEEDASESSDNPENDTPDIPEGNPEDAFPEEGDGGNPSSQEYSENDTAESDSSDPTEDPTPWNADPDTESDYGSGEDGDGDDGGENPSSYGQAEDETTGNGEDGDSSDPDGSYGSGNSGEQYGSSYGNETSAATENGSSDGSPDSSESASPEESPYGDEPSEPTDGTLENASPEDSGSDGKAPWEEENDPLLGDASSVSVNGSFIGGPVNYVDGETKTSDGEEDGEPDDPSSETVGEPEDDGIDDPLLGGDVKTERMESFLGYSPVSDPEGKGEGNSENG